MEKKFNWRTFKFDAQPEMKFSAPEIFDGEVVTTVDQRIRMLFSGSIRASVADALAIPAILRGRNLICNISTLPLITTRADNQVVLNEFLRQIDPALPNGKVLSMTLQDLIFYAQAYWMVTAFDFRDYVLRAEYVDFNRITEQDGQFWLDGKPVERWRIIDFHSTNPALLETISGSIERYKSMANASAMYANNPVPRMTITPKKGLDVDPPREQIEAAIQDLMDAAVDSPYVYAGAAVDLNPVNLLSPADLQLHEGLKMVALDFANALGIDAEDLGISTTSRTYQNAVDRRKDRVNDVLNVYMKAISDRLSMGDVTPEGYLVKFDQDDYLRADPKTRMEVYTGYIAAGVLTVDEVRAKEGLAPMTAEQKSALALQPAPEQKSLTASFSDDSAVDMMSFASAEFSAQVDTEARTVTVLAVPYGKVSRLNGQNRFMFSQGSITIPDKNNFSRIKLLRDHDSTQSVGKAIAIENTPEGLVVTFKVINGPEGDRSLAGFADGNYDGASIGVGDMTTSKDPKHPGVFQVHSSELREVSQVAIPSFDDARLISVKASAQGDEMTDNLDGAVNVAPEKTYTVAEFAAMQSMFGKPTKAPASVQNDPNVVPRELKANDQEKKVEFVSEPSLYRFDGKGDHEFSSDLINGLQRGNGEAMNRVNQYLAAEFAVSAANAATLNPTKDRPDMYVDQMDYEYPIWNTINRGTLSDITAFRFPKYSSSSGLVGPHTEGTEPTLGAMAFTNQSVQPISLSGKIEINREAWDQGGTPSLSEAILRQMRRAWNEGLETAAAAFLDAYTLPGGQVTTLTTAGTNSALVREVTRATAKLKFTRGGYRLTDFLVHEDLWTNLLLAEDSTGRPLFPMLGPTNANGTVGERHSGFELNGLAAKPAWALGASGIIAENSYLLTPEDVAGWASTPEFETFNIQVKSVYLGIWGYSAFAVQRDEGLRRFVYDPA